MRHALKISEEKLLKRTWLSVGLVFGIVGMALVGAWNAGLFYTTVQAHDAYIKSDGEYKKEIASELKELRGAVNEMNGRTSRMEGVLQEWRRAQGGNRWKRESSQ